MTAENVELLARHGLLVKKAAEAEEVARIMGLPTEEVTAALDAAVTSGDAVGARGRYMLTPRGRERLDAAYPEVFAELRSDQRFVGGYERFERVNRRLLALFTDWQTMSVGGERVPNDHSDPDYDARIVDRLGDLHEQAEPVLRGLAEPLPRLDLYVQRLAVAYDRVLAGEHDHVSGVRVDSYHTVWFELHEDLLRMLGRQREG